MAIRRGWRPYSGILGVLSGTVDSVIITKNNVIFMKNEKSQKKNSTIGINTNIVVSNSSIS